MLAGWRIWTLGRNNHNTSVCEPSGPRVMDSPIMRDRLCQDRGWRIEPPDYRSGIPPYVYQRGSGTSYRSDPASGEPWKQFFPLILRRLRCDTFDQPNG